MPLSLSHPSSWFRSARAPAAPRFCLLKTASFLVTMRDRGKNRKPLQRGRLLSIEAVQAVQALKRVKSSEEELHRVMQQKVRRLLKFDLMAVLAELQQQNEGVLALLIFEEVRKEHWYKPRLWIYGNMFKALANSGLLEKMEILISYLKEESFKDDIVGFNVLLQSLLESGLHHTAMDCYRMAKLWEIEPNRSTFEILLNGLESSGEIAFSEAVKDDAKEYFGDLVEYSDFLENISTSEHMNSHKDHPKG